jgi:hypothetical protein
MQQELPALIQLFCKRNCKEIAFAQVDEGASASNGPLRWSRTTAFMVDGWSIAAQNAL